LIFLIFATGWCNFFVISGLNAINYSRAQIEKATAKNAPVLFNPAKDTFLVWNLGYQQVIHNAEIFATAHY